jgi:flagella basal body P-ring formation protein FlgA
MRGPIFILAMLGALPASAWAETVVATRTIRAQEIIGPTDLALREGTVPGAITAPDQAIGQEARVALYPGRPVRHGDIGPPAIVERNQLVVLTYAAGGLRITAEARALGRGGIGDRIRVMNLASRSSLFGEVQADGTVQVRP